MDVNAMDFVVKTKGQNVLNEHFQTVSVGLVISVALANVMEGDLGRG